MTGDSFAIGRKVLPAVAVMTWCEASLAAWHGSAVWSAIGEKHGGIVALPEVIGRAVLETIYDGADRVILDETPLVPVGLKSSRSARPDHLSWDAVHFAVQSQSTPGWAKKKGPEFRALGCFKTGAP